MSCRHHWMIEPPSGVQHSTGQCKHCGAVRRDFANSVQISDWNGFNKKQRKGDMNKASAQQKKQGGRR